MTTSTSVHAGLQSRVRSREETITTLSKKRTNVENQIKREMERIQKLEASLQRCVELANANVDHEFSLSIGTDGSECNRGSDGEDECDDEEYTPSEPSEVRVEEFPFVVGSPSDPVGNGDHKPLLQSGDPAEFFFANSSVRRIRDASGGTKLLPLHASPMDSDVDSNHEVMFQSLRVVQIQKVFRGFALRQRRKAYEHVVSATVIIQRAWKEHSRIKMDHAKKTRSVMTIQKIFRHYKTQMNSREPRLSRVKSKISEARKHAKTYGVEKPLRDIVPESYHPESPLCQTSVVPSQQNHPLFSVNGVFDDEIYKEDVLAKRAMKSLQQYKFTRTPPTVAHSPKIKSTQQRADRRKKHQTDKMKEAKRREVKRKKMTEKARRKARKEALKVFKRQLKDEVTDAAVTQTNKDKGSIGSDLASKSCIFSQDTPLSQLAIKIARESTQKKAKSPKKSNECNTCSEKRMRYMNQEEVQQRVERVMNRADTMLQEKIISLFKSGAVDFQLEKGCNLCNTNREDYEASIKGEVQTKVDMVVKRAEQRLQLLKTQVMKLQRVQAAVSHIGNGATLEKCNFS